MFREVVRVTRKVFQVCICIAIAAFVIWRGNLCNDSSGGSHLIVPVMCVIAGVLVSLTGLALGFQGDE
jgi:hypothetical protein